MALKIRVRRSDTRWRFVWSGSRADGHSLLLYRDMGASISKIAVFAE